MARLLMPIGQCPVSIWIDLHVIVNSDYCFLDRSSYRSIMGIFLRQLPRAPPPPSFLKALPLPIWRPLVLTMHIPISFPSNFTLSRLTSEVNRWL
jgi:hypothetical protein